MMYYVQGWYLDDGVLAGETRAIGDLVRQVEVEASAIGLTLQPHKSTVWWPSEDPTRMSAFPPGFVRVRESGTILLGAPISHCPDFHQSCMQRRIDRVEELIDLLPGIDEPHTQLCLLRSCLSACRVTYSLRCSPPHLLTDRAELFDRGTARALRDIVFGADHALSAHAFTIASLPVSLGGLGVTPASDLVPFSFLSSYQSTADLQSAILPSTDIPEHPGHPDAVSLFHRRLPGTDRSALSSRAVPGSTRSLAATVAQQRRDSLLSSLPAADRLRALLQCTGQARASSWLYSLPRPAMPASAFRCRLQYQLGIPIYAADSSCSSCFIRMDRWGDHVLQCPRSSTIGFRRRHDQVQRALAQVCRRADVSVSQNRRPPTSIAPRLRAEPGDLCLHGWGAGGSDIYADVFVIHPWSATHPSFGSFQVRTRMDQEFRRKSRLYAPLFAAQEVAASFLPLGFDVFGGMHARTSDLLLDLQRRLCGGQVESGHLASTSDFSAFQYVSYCLAQCIGVQLASRLPMHVRFDSDPTFDVSATHDDIPSHVRGPVVRGPLHAV